MTDISERLDAHYEAAVNEYGEKAVFGVFLYGSWNYGTNLPDSDVDTKCILIPDIRHLAIEPYKTKHLDVDGEVCECMTIMHMIENWKKQNINFVEIMFTPYFRLGPDYEDFWIEEVNGYAPYALTEEKCEQIARYDLNKAVLSMTNQALNTLKRNPNDLKAIMNSARIATSLMLLTDSNINYNNVIQATPEIAGIRTGETKITEDYTERLESILKNMMERADNGEWAPNKEKQAEIDCMLNQFILDLINRRIALD